MRARAEREGVRKLPLPWIRDPGSCTIGNVFGAVRCVKMRKFVRFPATRPIHVIYPVITRRVSRAAFRFVPASLAPAVSK